MYSVVKVFVIYLFIGYLIYLMYIEIAVLNRIFIQIQCYSIDYLLNVYYVIVKKCLHQISALPVSLFCCVMNDILESQSFTMLKLVSSCIFFICLK